jgi:hypothetical protein
MKTGRWSRNRNCKRRAVAARHFPPFEHTKPPDYAVAIATFGAYSVIPLAAELADKFDACRRRKIDCPIDSVPRSAALLRVDKLGDGDG